MGETVGLERWLSAPVGRWSPRAAPTVSTERDGELVVVDYKTGRRVPDADDARRSPALALYALAARRTLRRPCRRVELHHLPSGTVAGVDHDEESLAAHRARAEAGAVALGAAADALDDPRAPRPLPARPGPRCGPATCAATAPRAAPPPRAGPWAGLAP